MAEQNEAAQDEVLQQRAAQADKIRQTLADVYTFVRSREVNRQIASFTLDHYIDEAKSKIKGEAQALRDAGGKTQDASGRAFGTRPTQLEALTTLQQDFDAGFDEMKKLAEALDAEREATS